MMLAEIKNIFLRPRVFASYEGYDSGTQLFCVSIQLLEYAVDIRRWNVVESLAAPIAKFKNILAPYPTSLFLITAILLLPLAVLKLR